MCIDNNWQRAKVHTQSTSGKQQTKCFLLHHRVISLVFVQFFVKIANRVFQPVHDLEQTSSNGHIGGIHSHDEGQLITWRPQNWSRLFKKDVSHCSVHTNLLFFFNNSVSGQVDSVVWNKMAEISGQTKETLNTLAINWLRKINQGPHLFLSWGQLTKTNMVT